jgi:hypothetical protein
MEHQTGAAPMEGAVAAEQGACQGRGAAPVEPLCRASARSCSHPGRTGIESALVQDRSKRWMALLPSSREQQQRGGACEARSLS